MEGAILIFVKVRNVLHNFFFARRVEADLDHEVHHHLAMLTEQHIHGGMSPQEAQRVARIDLGGIEQAKELAREQRIGNWLRSVISDCRYGLRQFRKRPGFTAVVMLTMVVGVGPTIAIFCVVNATLLRGLPYRNPSQLLEIGKNDPQGEPDSVSAADFVEWQDAAHSFQELAYAGDWKFYTMTGAGEPDEAWGWQVSDNLFQVLGVHAAMGRTFASAEYQSVILSNRYWRTHFSGDPGIVGRALVLDGKSFMVVGIMPRDFYFRMPTTDLWIPLPINSRAENTSENQSLFVIGRLKPGLTLWQARTELQGIQSRLAVISPKDNSGRTATARIMGNSGLGSFQTLILVFFGAVSFTLLIACVNVANMFLARSTTRQKEIALRSALGAGRFRIIRQLLTEYLLIAGFSGLIGLALAMAALRLFVRLIPSSFADGINGLQGITLSLPVMGFALAISLLAGFAVGLVPALRSSEPDLNKSLKEGAAATTSPFGQIHLQGLLVILEIGLTLILLVGAGLMTESFYRLAKANIGFDPNHVLTIRVPLVDDKYSQGPRSSAFYERALERVKAVPGVESAALTNNLPLSGFDSIGYYTLPGRSSGDLPQKARVGLQAVSSGYFRAMGIPLLRGRDFTVEDERSGTAKVAIVSDSMANRYWPGENSLGKLLDSNTTVVGVVADIRRDSPGEAPSPQVYVPYGQKPFASFLITFIVRTSSNPLGMAAEVRTAIQSLDQDQPVIQIRTMKEVVAESIWQTDFSMKVLTMQALLALFLSAVGIYGVISYTVSQRTREIGIRIALGAQRQDILKLVIGRGIVWALLGIVLGIGGSLFITRFIASMLYIVKPTDPTIFAAVVFLVGSLALSACFFPVQRAARVDPLVALRDE
jgi:putative ABC transport system permease protein